MSTILELWELDAVIQRGDDVVFPFEFNSKDSITGVLTPIDLTWSTVYMVLKTSANATTVLKELKTSVHDDVNKTHLTLASADSTELPADSNLYYLLAIKDTSDLISTQVEGTVKTSLSITPPPSA